MSKSEHFDTVTLERLIVLGEIYRLDGTVLAPVGSTSLPFTDGLTTAGQTLIASSSATTHHRLKGLVAGTGITIVDSGDDITINNTGDADFATFAQQAGSGGASLVGTDTSGGSHYVRGVAGIEGVSAAVVGEDVVVRLDPATALLSPEVTATGSSLVGSNSAAPTFRVRGIAAGPGIDVAVVGEDVVVTLAQQANTRVYLDSATTIALANGLALPVPFDTVEYDDDGSGGTRFSVDTYTNGATAFFGEISGCVCFEHPAGVGGGTPLQMEIRVSGEPIRVFRTDAIIGGGTATVYGCVRANVPASATIQIIAYQTTGLPLNINGAGETSLQVRSLGPAI